MDYRIKQLVRDNRGLRLHVWLVLAGSVGPLLAVDIAGEIGCHRDSVSDALRAMESDGYTAALGPGRHPRWVLTDKARQLSLPGLEDYVEAEKFRLSGSSSSSLIEETAELVREPLLPPDLTRKNSASDLERLADVLYNEVGGVTRARARQVVGVALNRGDSARWVELQILAWWVYAESPRGRTINAVGRFVAAKIEGDETAPMTPVEPARGGTDWSAWRSRFAGVLRRIEALESERDDDDE